VLGLADGTRYYISAMTEGQVGKLVGHVNGAVEARDVLGKFGKYLM
jgi:hypothetical protein